MVKEVLMTKTALVIIDVQNEMFLGVAPVHNSEKLLFNLKLLIKHARKSKIPIYYIQHNSPVGTPLEHGSTGWEIHSEIKPLAEDYIIQKTTPDSFHKTDLNEILMRQKIEQLIITGIQSEICVDTTCRKAFSLGYSGTIVTDAHSTWDSKELTAQQIINHHNQVLKWFAKTKSTVEIVL